MLRSLAGGLARWIFVVVFGLVTFWPDWGVAALAYRFFPAAPLPVVAFCCAWAIPLALVLPLNLKQFRIASSASIAGIYGAGLVTAAANGVGVADVWWLWMLGAIFVVFGWMTVATPLWRWARGIVAVQDAEAAE